jgi:thiamine kinase-like enzyme
MFRDQFDSVFGPLRVPKKPLQPIFDRFETLSPRPFRLLNHDLHRGNIILGPDNHTVVLDWELALVGDPLSDLANHFHLMRYSKAEQQAVLRGWLDKMPPALKEGWQPDLEHHLKFRVVQSVIWDTIRTTRYVGKNDASLDEGHKLIVDLTDKLNAAGRNIWGWKEPLSVDYVAKIIRAFHNNR